MSDPFSIAYGPWAPDLQNVAQELPAQLGMTTVPSADCLNVYYQDGAYRCLPGPIATGPSLGSQALNAFPWYDNTQAVALLFAGTSGGISQLEDGIWSPVGVENSISVAVSGWMLRSVLAGLTAVQPWKLASTLGSVGVTGGTLYTGTLSAGSQTFGGGVGSAVGFVAGSYGAMSPASDLNGHALNSFGYFTKFGAYSTFFSVSASVPQTYFSSIILSTISTTLFESAATFTSSSSLSTWTWPGALSIASGGNYPVTIKR